ncbi:hypothetical protein [Variovorax sp. DAIF25]|uniref:hypothetical protein n=1 Tax=Variovorax sp. DAIF25 TaxID=3080983 RepID=UPI003D6AD38C
MYSDPSLIRKHVIKLNLNDLEADLINAYVAFSGEQKATLLREQLLRKAVEVLHGGNSGGAVIALRGANQFLSAA